jgi:hypothetical protein
MKRLLYRSFIFMASGLLLMSGLAIAQSGRTPDEKPPIAQPLVREGDFAVKLTGALKLGTTSSEIEAESILGSAGIVPRNGWIADYPVTPDIIGELQTAIAEAAAAGKLAMGKDEALRASQDLLSGYDLSIKTGAPGQQGSTAPGTNYPESPVINNYYYDEGPPVVSYYAPPPDYAYMYTWVPYPFWWWTYWYPGFFILVDFHVPVYGHGYGGHGGYVSNHYRDVGTGGISRIDPANRAHGGIYPDRRGAGLSSPSARSGAQAILERSQGGASTGASRVFRGYGQRPPAGTRPSAFERPRNSRFERAASDRGFQSRSNAGRITNQVPGGRAVSPGVPRQNQGGRGAGSGPRPSGRGGPGGDGGGFHGGERR